MQQDFKSYDEKMKEVFDKVKEERKSQDRWMKRFINENMWYRSKFGPKPLSGETRKKIEGFLEQIEALSLR